MDSDIMKRFDDEVKVHEAISQQVRDNRVAIEAIQRDIAEYAKAVGEIQESVIDTLKLLEDAVEGKPWSR